jgi:hypothetical protein
VTSYGSQFPELWLPEKKHLAGSATFGCWFLAFSFPAPDFCPLPCALGSLQLFRINPSCAVLYRFPYISGLHPKSAFLRGKVLGFRLRAITAIARDYGDPRSLSSALISGRFLPFNFGDFWQFWQSLLIRDHPR